MNVGAVVFIILSSVSITEGAPRLWKCVTSPDVAMVLDGSTSMGVAGFWSIKSFAIDMIRNMDVGPEATHVCLVQFTMGPAVVFNLTTYFSSSELESAIDALVYEEGATGIDAGLELAAGELFRQEGGARLNVPKFLVVFTDGDFMSYHSDPWINGTHVIAIGGGPKINKEELKSLVRNPSKDFFTTDDSAQSVVQRMRVLAQQDCNAP
ncbi:integrin alpha-1-like [Oculina patagonica]